MDADQKKELSALRVKRGVCKSKLTRLKNYFEGLDEGQFDEREWGILAAKFEKFEGIWDEFAAYQTDIEILIVNDNDIFVQESQERDIFEDGYCTLVVDIKSMLNKHYWKNNDVFRNSEHLGNAAATFQPPQDPRRDPETENLRALRHSVAASEPFRAVRPENRGTTMFYAIVFVSLLAKSTLAEPLLRTCEPIRVDLCMGLGYNMTGMPNLGGNDVQQEADYNLKSYSPLIQYGCSQQLKLFLCSVYVPMCTEKVANPIGPCRGLCESVRSRCYPVLQGFGFSWPDALNCSRFPVENNHEHMCMEGPKEKVDIRAPVEPAVRKFDCSPHGLRNGLPDCNPSPCGADNMFDESEKRIAEVWITVWALACIAASLGSLLTLALGGGRVRAPPLLGLSLCYLLVGAGWALRSFAGPTGGSCRIPSPTGLKTDDGLPNVICAFVFLLLYYFGMAANAWWVCLCAWWVARAGFSWTPEKMRSLTTILNVCTWGFPAAQTVAALVQRNVDSDELTGN
ncbi:unnamed protein product [Ceutorhynchus assimilis]|uniref:Frizzled-4 n=1 Tax=Ceutorhynchus assimilis TaxID=467358 RepID=A0A9N9QJJ0_9CUCU|nr:unnamed protein product [Ceutorhynchus assimilis]